MLVVRHVGFGREMRTLQLLVHVLFQVGPRGRRHRGRREMKGCPAVLRVEDTRERCGEATASCAELTENCGRDNTCQGDNVTNDA